MREQVSGSITLDTAAMGRAVADVVVREIRSSLVPLSHKELVGTVEALLRGDAVVNSHGVAHMLADAFDRYGYSVVTLTGHGPAERESSFFNDGDR